jgi:hypothetical protein
MRQSFFRGMLALIMMVGLTALGFSWLAAPAFADSSLATFSGVVMTSAGQPVSGVSVGLGSGQAITAADGSFTVNAPPGVYTLSMGHSPFGGAPQFEVSGASVDLTQGSVTEDITLPLATVNVTVLDSNGDPVPGATLAGKEGGPTSAVTFDAFPGGSVTGTVNLLGGTANSDGILSYASFLGAGPVTGVLTGPSGSPQTTVAIPAVTTDPTNATVYLEPPGQSPDITSASSATAGMRSPFDFTVTTTGVPAPAITESGTLPSGMTFTDNGDGTASLAGTAAAGTAGSYPITITASNGVGFPASQSFTLTISTAASAPDITSDAADTETFGEPFSFTVDTSGYPAPKLTKTASLPPGVTFTDNGDGTATIAGTPAKSAVGTYPLTLTAKNSAGTATQAFTLTITKAPVIKKIPDTTAHVGTALNLTITASGYTAPAITETGTLPGGLSLTDNSNGTATINGTPATGSGGTYPVTITAANSLGTASQTFTLKIDQAPAITSPDTATAATGSAFSFQVSTTGYPAPKLTKAGSLPKGVTFTASTRTFSGTPKADTSGTYPITITATNTSGTATQNLTLTVS